MSIRTLGEIGAPAPVPSRRSAESPAPSPYAAPAPLPSLPVVDIRDLARAIGAVNLMLDPMARGLQFSVDESTGSTVVKLVDKETNEVLRQIPSKEMLSIARALDRVQGLLVNAKA
jgi:flagellar protein FlaG